MCLRFKFFTHQMERVCVLNFLKKIQIHCTLLYTLDGVKRGFRCILLIRVQYYFTLFNCTVAD
jgi:hypothetical protein